MMRLDLVTHCRALLLPPRPPLGANARAACAPPVLSLFSAHPQAVGHARRFGLRQAATCHSVKHPFRNFQTAGRPVRRLSTSKCPRAFPRYHIVDETHAGQTRGARDKILPVLRSCERYVVAL